VKKILSICMVLAMVFTNFIPINASSRTNDPIKDILGVDYTIQSIEYTWTDDRGTWRFQFIDFNGKLDLNKFSYSYSGIHAPSDTGDAFIETCGITGTTFLVIDLGPNPEGWRRFNSTPVDVKLEPVETIVYFDYKRGYSVPKPCFERFGMDYEYITDNIYFRTNERNSQWLPILAEGVESYWERMMQVFPAPSEKLILYLFDIDDLVEAAYFWEELEEHVAEHGDGIYPGNAYWMAHNIAVVAGPRGRTEVSELLITTAVHELVHVLQRDVYAWGESPQWVHEGAANYLAGNTNPAIPVLVEAVRKNRLPTLDDLECPDANRIGTSNYILFTVAAKSIFQFISDTFGMEYILPLHENPNDYQGIFGISRSEFQRQWHRYLRTNYRNNVSVVFQPAA
jgi:hypothetical protein